MLFILLFLPLINSLSTFKFPVWLDTDPGIDDAFAISFLATHPSINLIGLSSASGNIRLSITSQNALDILYSLNRTDVDVYMGVGK